MAASSFSSWLVSTLNLCPRPLRKRSVVGMMLLASLSVLGGEKAAVAIEPTVAETRGGFKSAHTESSAEWTGAGSTSFRPDESAFLLSQQAPAITLERGDSGDAVSVLQQRLTELGYYSGPISGFFGELTESAVIQFQQNRGLAADGIVGPTTTEALRRAPSSNASSGSLTRESSGQAVTDLQRRLQTLGYYDGPITGFYGSMTEAAVRRFQAAQGLAVDGIAGPSTLSAIQRAGQSSNRPSVPETNTPDPNDGLLEEGEAGAEVAELQRRLKNLNYYTGAVDGEFGPLTADAVLRFQRSQGLTADGVVGPATLSAISRLEQRPSNTTASTSSSSASSPSSSAPPITSLPPVPSNALPSISSASPSPSFPVSSAQPTANQESVMALQRKLQDQGFYDGPIDGIIGPETQRAIDAARNAYGVTPSDFSNMGQI